MKQFKLHFLLVVVCAGFFVSCKDDDDDKKTIDNKITMDESFTKIEKGVFVYDIDASKDGVYRNELLFAGAGIEAQANGTDDITLTGKGMLLVLLVNNDQQELLPGTYTWQTEEHYQPFDLWDADIYKDWNMETEQAYGFTEGTVVVSKTESAFTITVTGIVYPRLKDGEDWGSTDLTADPITVTAQYQGTLQILSGDF